MLTDVFIQVSFEELNAHGGFVCVCVVCICVCVRERGERVRGRDRQIWIYMTYVLQHTCGRQRTTLCCPFFLFKRRHHLLFAAVCARLFGLPAPRSPSSCPHTSSGLLTAEFLLFKEIKTNRTR